MGNDGNGLVEALLGLPGFRVLAVAEGPSELVVTVETVLDRVGCTNCGVRAEAQDRMAMAVRDLACFGRQLGVDETSFLAANRKPPPSVGRAGVPDTDRCQGGRGRRADGFVLCDVLPAAPTR